MKSKRSIHSKIILILSVFLTLLLLAGNNNAFAQNFDFNSIEKKIADFTVIVDLTIEVSFGMNSAEHEEQFLGTIVTKEGMVIFNGSSIGAEGSISMRGFSIKSEPVKIEIKTLDGEKYEAELLGVDRFTNIGFLQIKTDKKDFKPVKFLNSSGHNVGDWIALYMLLPDFIEPPIAADVGMVSSVIKSPEEFYLTMGFSPMQLTSVLFNKDNQAIGILGQLMDPSQASIDASGLIESFGQFGVPLLGIITSTKLQKLIADPPNRETWDRGWLGISLQALTEDISSFLKIDAEGGIIVNEVVNKSPSQKAGILVGDILIKLNGQPIEVDKEDKLPIFQRGIAEMGPGTEVEFEVIRQADDKLDTLNIFVQLEKTPTTAKDANEYESKSIEFVARDMVFSDYLFNDLDDENFKGVVVSELRQGGLAYVGGLFRGDIIQKIGSQKISTVDELQAVMEQAEEEKPSEIIFFIWRNNKTMFVNVKTDWADN